LTTAIDPVLSSCTLIKSPFLDLIAPFTFPFSPDVNVCA
jgi:hypothetical protein